MKIILDTNVITRDYFLNGARIMKLNDAARQLGYVVMIPQVVVDEILNQHKEELEDAFGKFKKGCRLLNKLGISGIKDTLEAGFLEIECNAMRQNYLERLAELDIVIIPYPQTPHETLVRKELDNKKPFRSSQKGYRDSLIWESVKNELFPVKNLLGVSQIIFLSNNSDDFANKDKSLHQDLEEELTALGYLGNEVELVTNVNEFFLSRINPELEELASIENALKTKKKFNRLDLEAELSTALYDSYVIGDYLLEEMKQPAWCECLTVEDINLEKVDSVAAHKLSDGTVVIECGVSSLAELNYSLFKADYALFDEEKAPTILDWDWNDHYYLACSTCKIKSIVTLRASEGLYRVLSREVRTKDVLWDQELY